MRTGIVGGFVADALLQRLGHATAAGGGACSGASYAQRNKLEVMLGTDIWEQIRGCSVLDFGCGDGEEAVAMAAHGAKRVVGLDIQETLLAMAEANARRAGVSERCAFV